MGRTLLDWLEHVALPEEARMADRALRGRYGTAVSARARVARHDDRAGLRRALFADATARAVRGGHRVRACASSRVWCVSDRLLRPDLHLTPEQAYAESTTAHRALSQARAAVVRGDAAVRAVDIGGDARGLRAAHGGAPRRETADPHQRDPAGDCASWRACFRGPPITSRSTSDTTSAATGRSWRTTSTRPPRRSNGLPAPGTAVAHCPGSNAALGSGCFPLRRHVDAGVTCALGTDVGGGLGFGMMKEGLHAYLMQRLAPDPAAAGCCKVSLSGDASRRRGARARDGDRRFSPRQGGGLRVSPAAGGQRARVGRSARRQPRSGACRRCSRWRARRRCARFASKGRRYSAIDRMTIDDLNSRDRAGFVEAVGWVFEDSPWVAERAWAQRPFATLDALHEAMVSAVASATSEEQLALLRAHPDLGAAREDVGCVGSANRPAPVSIALTRDELERLARA